MDSFAKFFDTDVARKHHAIIEFQIIFGFPIGNNFDEHAWFGYIFRNIPKLIIIHMYDTDTYWFRLWKWSRATANLCVSIRFDRIHVVARRMLNFVFTFLCIRYYQWVSHHHFSYILYCRISFLVWLWREEKTFCPLNIRCNRFLLQKWENFLTWRSS